MYLFQDAEKFNRLVAAPTAIIARDIIVSSKHSISAHAHLVPTWWGSEVDGSRWRVVSCPDPTPQEGKEGLVFNVGILGCAESACSENGYIVQSDCWIY